MEKWEKRKKNTFCSEFLDAYFKYTFLNTVGSCLHETCYWQSNSLISVFGSDYFRRCGELLL